MERKIVFVEVAFFSFWVLTSFSTYSQTQKHIFDGVAQFTLGEPMVIMSSSADATESSYDNKYLGYFSILQLKPNLFYMYYECNGTNRHVDNHIAFAYSTDGMNWVRSYPEGVSHIVYNDKKGIISNSNLITFQDVLEFDVVKVPDLEYPFRMVANERVNKDEYMNDTHLCMWKSKDGVNFEEKVVLLPSKHDTQPSVIVRGNMMKIYLRLRGPESLSERHIGYMFVDLEGTMITPPTLLSNDLYYTSAASILDDNREILFPTYFDQKHPEDNHYEACIVEDNTLYKIDADMSALTSGDDKWGMICPHIITISHAQYLAYHQANFDHNLVTSAKVRKTELRLSKITFITQGLPCPPSLKK